LSHCQWLLLS